MFPPRTPKLCFACAAVLLSISAAGLTACSEDPAVNVGPDEGSSSTDGTPKGQVVSRPVLDGDTQQLILQDAAFLDHMQYTKQDVLGSLAYMQKENQVAWDAGYEAGDPAALHLRAWCHMTGTGQVKNPGLGTDLFRRSAEAGYGPAFAAYAYALEEGGDMRESVVWLKRGVALGDPGSQLNLGYLYEEGLVPGERADLARAFNLYLRSAKQGNPAAMWNVGNCYIDGKGGVTRDLTIAARWLEKAAQENHRLAKAKLEEVRRHRY